MLIGYKVKVLEREMEGIVIDETRNTIVLKTSKGIKRVIKDGNRFIVNMYNKEIKVSGKEIKMRSWEYAL